ncbi:MAG: hypothetical protein CBC09_07030 [Cellvibrionales bacterium TMED49]|nr:MAG: hypothetical protein CBC09_07030 [Cellvibrionales bacterium TMED49]
MILMGRNALPLTVILSILLIFFSSVSGSVEDPRIVIIKADDVRKRTVNWDKFFAISRMRGVPVSAGVICNSIEKNDEQYSNWIRASHESGWVEFWNHGYDHKRWKGENGLKFHEFNRTGYDHQKKHFETCQQLLGDVLGKEPIAFGAPYNAIDKDTLKVIHENSNLRLIFSYAKKNTSRVNALMVLRGEQDGTGKPNFKKFVSAYEQNSNIRFTALQFHPNAFNESAFEEYVQIIEFLIREGWKFYLPRDYVDQKKITIKKIHKR